VDWSINWQQVGAAVAVLVTVSGGLLWALRASLRDAFVPAKAHAELRGRVQTIEQRLQTAPTHEDVQRLSGRLQQLEIGVAVVRESQDGMAESVKRIEHQVGLLISHLLKREES
jgi:hypothetical protein